MKVWTMSSSNVIVVARCRTSSLRIMAELIPSKCGRTMWRDFLIMDGKDIEEFFVQDELGKYDIPLVEGKK